MGRGGEELSFAWGRGGLSGVNLLCFLFTVRMGLRCLGAGISPGYILALLQKCSFSSHYIFVFFCFMSNL